MQHGQGHLYTLIRELESWWFAATGQAVLCMHTQAQAMRRAAQQPHICKRQQVQPIAALQTLLFTLVPARAQKHLSSAEALWRCRVRRSSSTFSARACALASASFKRRPSPSLALAAAFSSAATCAWPLLRIFGVAFMFTAVTMTDIVVVLLQWGTVLIVILSLAGLCLVGSILW